MSLPVLSFANTLGFKVNVYDSFSTQDKSNYIGSLTLLATVPAKSTASIQLIHLTSVLIISNGTTNIPLARRIYSELLTTTKAFGVAQADVDAMSQTMSFITFITSNPGDSVAVAFKAIWKDTSQPQVTPVNQFFAQNPTYEKCTFATYMMGIAYMAQLPASKSKPLDQSLYSLSTLAKLLGGTWPSEIPDIVVTKFTCDTKNDVLAIRAEIDLKKLPAQSDRTLKFFGSLFSVQKLEVAFSFNYGFNLGVTGTRLSISLDTMKVPFGGSSAMNINKPTVTIDINPLFKFVVFTVSGSIPFNVFGKEFEADVSMLIDNIEASFGVVIKGDNTSLPAPPIMQGVHFDEFGVGIGIIFEPPGAAIGLSGKLHIGELDNGTQVALADDSFAIVCQLVEEVPNPLYVSFYVPQMHLTDVLTIFTNAQSSIDVPVSFTDLSFQWSENPMMPVALPDGSLSNMGYGFSAAANIFSFSFYGDVEINLEKGLKADMQMAPLSLGSLFSMGGDGPGVQIKADASGNPIKNNLLATTAERRKVLKDPTMKQLVPSGGAVLRLQTFSSPFLHLNAFVSLFEIQNEHLAADVTSSGIQFEITFGTLLTTTMKCTLSDWHNLAASFSFGIDKTISLPSIAGVSLGSILLQTTASIHFSLNTSTSDIILSVGGAFTFEDTTLSFGDFTADIHIQQLTDLLSFIKTSIEKNAQQIFSDILNTGSAWAGKVQQGIITAADSVASVLHHAFDQTADQVAATMRDAGFGLDAITAQLKQIFDPGQVASALKDVFDLSVAGVTDAMKQVGYTGQEVAGALKSAFDEEAKQVAEALKSAYGWGVDQVQDALSGIGFSTKEIGDAFQALGGEFADKGRAILDALDPENLERDIERVIDPENLESEIEHALDPRNWFD